MRDGVLHVHQPDHVQRLGQLDGAAADAVLVALRDDVRRDDRRGVAGVDPRLLDVLHHAGDDDVAAVADRVDVELDGVLEEAIDEDRMSGRGLHRQRHVLAQARLVVDDGHGAPAEDVRRPHHDREADLVRDRHRLVDAHGRTVIRQQDPVLEH